MPKESFVFSMGRGQSPYGYGGGGSGGYSSYEQTAPQSSYSEKREDLAYKRAREEREASAADLRIRREKRLEDAAGQIDSIAFRREKRLEEADLRRAKREEDIDIALDFVDKKLGNPASMKFQDNYEEIMVDPIVHRAMVSKDGRAILSGMMKERHDAHENYVKSWQAVASNYKYTGDIAALPLSSNGEINKKAATEKLNKHLFNANLQEQQSREMARQKAESLDLQVTKIDPITGDITEYGVKKIDDMFANAVKEKEAAAKKVVPAAKPTSLKQAPTSPSPKPSITATEEGSQSSQPDISSFNR
jgi:hypothetical protein